MQVIFRHLFFLIKSLQLFLINLILQQDTQSDNSIQLGFPLNLLHRFGIIASCFGDLPDVVLFCAFFIGR